MKFFNFLSLLNDEFSTVETKIRLATHNGAENPIDVYLAGEFNNWQRWQTRKNFERKYVVSFISLPNEDKWLFVGLHLSCIAEWKEKHSLYYYELAEDPKCSEMNGRAIVKFTRPGRQPYLNAEKWVENIQLHEVLPEPLSIEEFPGFKAINLTKAELELVVRQSKKSWRTALSCIAGVYLIADTSSGKLYVGSATGEEGIWQRWSEYAKNSHGGNVELRKLLRKEGAEHAKYFRYSILEIADTHASRDDIIKRETHWKKVLLSREYGLNEN